MNFEEWYAKLGEWAEENTALNMSHAMQRHLARHLEEWEASRPTKRGADEFSGHANNCVLRSGGYACTCGFAEIARR